MADAARTVPQRRLAWMLRRLRGDAGLTIDQVAEQLDLSPSTISRMETAEVSVRTNDLRPLDIYEVPAYNATNCYSSRGNDTSRSGGAGIETCPTWCWLVSNLGRIHLAVLGVARPRTSPDRGLCLGGS
jgi:transcriptional regulator with XRE-family HTH domain